MARVIGIPLIKGNSEVIVSVEILEADRGAVFEGQAVYVVDGSPVSGEVVVSTVASAGSFYGWVLDINDCTGYASCLRSAESVYLPAESGFAIGDPVTINETTGLIDPAGTITTNGEILHPDVTELLNKKGEYIRMGQCIRIAGARAVSTGAVSAKSTKKAEA